MSKGRVYLLTGKAASSQSKIMKKKVEELEAIFAVYHNEVGVISPYFIDDKIRLNIAVPSTKQTVNKYYKNKRMKS